MVVYQQFYVVKSNTVNINLSKYYITMLGDYTQEKCLWQ